MADSGLLEACKSELGNIWLLPMGLDSRQPGLENNIDAVDATAGHLAKVNVAADCFARAGQCRLSTDDVEKIANAVNMVSKTYYSGFENPRDGEEKVRERFVNAFELIARIYAIKCQLDQTQNLEAKVNEVGFAKVMQALNDPTVKASIDQRVNDAYKLLNLFFGKREAESFLSFLK